MSSISNILVILFKRENTEVANSKNTSESNNELQIPLNGNKAELEGNTDSYKSTSTENADNEIYTVDYIYDKLKNLFNEHNINIKDAKDKELVQRIIAKINNPLDEQLVNNICKILDDKLSFVDNFTKKDDEYFNNLVDETIEAYYDKLMGTNMFKKKVTKFATITGLNGVKQCNSVDDFEDHFDKKFLNKVDEALVAGNVDEAKKLYKEFATKFYECYLSIKDDSDATIALISSLKSYPKAHLKNIVDVIMITAPSELIKEELAKLYPKIVMSKDKLSNETSEETAIYAASSIAKYGGKVTVQTLNSSINEDPNYTALKEKQTRGEDLTSEEEEALKNYESKLLKPGNTGIALGVPQNEGLELDDQKKILSDVNKRLEEYGLKDSVYKSVRKYSSKYDSKLKETIEDMLNEVSEGSYNEVVYGQPNTNQNNNNNNYDNQISPKSNNENVTNATSAESEVNTENADSTEVVNETSSITTDCAQSSIGGNYYNTNINSTELYASTSNEDNYSDEVANISSTEEINNNYGLTSVLQNLNDEDNSVGYNLGQNNLFRSITKNPEKLSAKFLSHLESSHPAVFLKLVGIFKRNDPAKQIECLTKNPALIGPLVNYLSPEVVMALDPNKFAAKPYICNLVTNVQEDIKYKNPTLVENLA